MALYKTNTETVAVLCGTEFHSGLQAARGAAAQWRGFLHPDLN